MPASLAIWLVLSPVLLAWILLPPGVGAMRVQRQAQLKDDVRGLFKHGFDGYMEYAYPADELRSLTCTPLNRDPNPGNVGVNDIHANVSMTLLDTLSSLPLIYPEAFPAALKRVATVVSFDQDVKIQVFELTIRALGSLLSTYQYLGTLPDGARAQASALGVEERILEGMELKRYKPRLLELALDLANRLLPAFRTPTGLPYARVNLRHGVERGESVETCTAGAGSLILEFAVLSRLTGDDRFESLAQRAYIALWNRRSANNLLGNTIAVTHGQWHAPGMTTVGAGMDSWYEYSLKASILLGDDTYLDIFHDSYAAVQSHLRTDDGFIYRPTQYRSLQHSSPSLIDSLAAFVPGMQVLAGDVESGIKTHLVYWNIWRKHSAIPESWDWQNRRVEWAGWPGRPEFLESTYYLYKATRDPFYLRVGERVLNDMKRRTMTECGFATMKNVDTGELDDRMESFVLSETLKYLYLLFDASPTPLSNRVFTTEGHSLSLPHSLLRPPSPTRRVMHRGENIVCPAYRPPTLNGLVVGIERRADYEHARSLVFGLGTAGTVIEDKERVMWWEGGFCEVPRVSRHSFDISLAPLNHTGEGAAPLEDASPSADKVHQDEKTGHLWIHKIDGLRLGVRWRLDNSGYDILNIGPHRVRPGQQVIVTDPQMEGFLPVPTESPAPTHLPTEVLLRFAATAANGQQEVFLHAMAGTATFGKDFSATAQSSASGSMSVFTLGGPATRIERPSSNIDGCDPFPRSDLSSGVSLAKTVLVLDRGECTFFRKALNAKQAGAAGIIVVGAASTSHPSDTPLEGILQESDVQAVLAPEEGLIRPSAEEEPDYLVHRLGSEFGVLYMDRAGATPMLQRLLAQAEQGGEVTVQLIDTRQDGDPADQKSGHGPREGEGAKPNRQQRTVPREGRVMVAGWDILNLRIIEKPP